MARPSKYGGIDLAKVSKLACLGLTDKQLAAALDISEATINNFKKKKAFLEALKAGKLQADETVERSLFERACGYIHKETKFFSHEGKVIQMKEVDKIYPPDVTACIFWLKNRQPKRWRDMKGVEHSGPDGGAIPLAPPTINPRDMTDEQLNQYLEEAASRKSAPKKNSAP